MLKSNLTPAEHDDMLLTPYLQVETMPAILRDTLRVARTDEERDMLLIMHMAKWQNGKFANLPICQAGF